MLVLDNPVKAKLKRGETAIGTMLFEFFVPGVPRLMADSVFWQRYLAALARGRFDLLHLHGFAGLLQAVQRLARQSAGRGRGRGGAAE